MIKPLVGEDYERRQRQIQLAAASRSERTIIRRRTQHLVRPPRHSHIRGLGEGGESTDSVLATRSSTELSPMQHPSQTNDIQTKPRKPLREREVLNENESKSNLQENWELDLVPIEALVDLFPGKDNQELIEQYRVPTPEVGEPEVNICDVILQPPDDFADDMTDVTFCTEVNFSSIVSKTETERSPDVIPDDAKNIFSSNIIADDVHVDCLRNETINDIKTSASNLKFIEHLKNNIYRRIIAETLTFNIDSAEDISKRIAGQHSEFPRQEIQRLVEMSICTSQAIAQKLLNRANLAMKSDQSGSLSLTAILTELAILKARSKGEILF